MVTLAPMLGHNLLGEVAEGLATTTSRAQFSDEDSPLGISAKAEALVVQDTRTSYAAARRSYRWCRPVLRKNLSGTRKGADEEVETG